MNKLQTRRMLKVKGDIESMLWHGELKRFGFTQCMVEILLDIYTSLANEKSAECITKKVKDYFEQRKFTVKEKGIGWEISL